MADDKPPMRFGPGAPQGTDGQFARMPVDPAQVLKDGGYPQKWTPLLGNGTAPNSRGKIPWPEVRRPPPPFRNLSNRR